MSFWKNERVLITGGSGFIGSHLADTLSREGAEVSITSCGERSTKLRARAAQEHLLVLPDEARAEEIIRKVKPSVVFHLAGIVRNPRASSEDFHNVNTRGTQEVFNASKRAGVKHFVTLGSALEYQGLPIPWRENSEGRPDSPYGQSKLAATKILASEEASETITTVARASTVYGPRQEPIMAVPIWIRACLNSEPVPLPLGEQKADFLFVEDLVQGLLKIANRSRGGFEIINLASGRATNVRTAARIIKEYLNQKKGNQYYPDSTKRIQRLSIEKAERLLDWRPTTTLSEGLRKTSGWYRDQTITAKEISAEASVSPQTA